jgi:hypothetical protein
MPVRSLPVARRPPPEVEFDFARADRDALDDPLSPAEGSIGLSQPSAHDPTRPHGRTLTARRM